MSRLLNKPRQIPPERHTELDQETKKDLTWWQKILPDYNGVSLIWMYHDTQPDRVLTSDTCLAAYGVVCGTQYLTQEFL